MLPCFEFRPSCHHGITEDIILSGGRWEHFPSLPLPHSSFTFFAMRQMKRGFVGGMRKGSSRLSFTHSSIPLGCLVYSGEGIVMACIIVQSLTIESSIVQVLRFSFDALFSFVCMCLLILFSGICRMLSMVTLRLVVQRH